MITSYAKAIVCRCKAPFTLSCFFWSNFIPNCMEFCSHNAAATRYVPRSKISLRFSGEASCPILVMQCKFFCVYRPYKESISKKMNNVNNEQLNLHNITKLSGKLRYCSAVRGDVKVLPATLAGNITQQYPELSDGSTVKNLKGVQVALRLGDDHSVFIKARVVSFAIQKRYEEALEKLLKGDIIENTLSGPHQRSP